MNQTISEQIHINNRTDLKLHSKLHFMFIIDGFSGKDWISEAWHLDPIKGNYIASLKPPAAWEESLHAYVVALSVTMVNPNKTLDTSLPTPPL